MGQDCCGCHKEINDSSVSFLKIRTVFMIALGFLFMIPAVEAILLHNIQCFLFFSCFVAYSLNKDLSLDVQYIYAFLYQAYYLCYQP